MDETNDLKSPHSKIRELFNGLVLLVGSLLVGILAVEGVLRLTTPRETMRYFFMMPDSVLHHKFIPNGSGNYETTEFSTSYQINSLGLRDREFEIPKPADTFRILMLGDSFTEGDGVESHETFSKVLEDSLNRSSSHLTFEVINAGVGSYSALLEYLYLKDHGLRLEPDLVILNFDLSDVYDDIQYTLLLRRDFDGDPIGVAPVQATRSQGFLGFLERMKDFLKENTRIYNFVRIRIDQILEGIRHEGNFSGDVQFDKYAMLRSFNQSNGLGEWKLSLEYLVRIRDLLKNEEVDFWITVYPYGLQVSSREWGSGRVFWGFKRDTIYSTKPQTDLIEFCLSNGIHGINMCDDFVYESALTYPLFLDYNGHWTPAGHKVAANVLANELQGYLTSGSKTNQRRLQK